MAFFEQLGKRITDAGQGVAQQTKNFADITRLNSAVSDKERKIAQLYQSIGQSYYERHSGDAEPQLQPAVEEIKALFAEIAQHKEEIKQIKGIVKCPHCGADVPFQAAAPAEEPAEDVQICPVCGTASGKDNLFCTHCGAKLKEKENQEG